jgi:hypothetical protein
MKTKALIIAAAVFAAGLTNSLANNITLTFVPGYNLCAPPLQGANMSADAMLTCLEPGDTLWFWNGSGYDIDFYNGPGDWYDGQLFYPISAPVLVMGHGFFYQNNSATTEINTYTGTALTGGSEVLVAGYNLIGSFVPVSGAADSLLFNLPLQSGDTLWLWTGYGWEIDYYNAPGDWYDGQSFYPISAPVLGIGQGFFYQNNGLSTTWNQ